MSVKQKIHRKENGRCPYCHDEDLSGQNYRTCGGCGAKQHRKCWEDHGSCAACGEQPRSKELRQAVQNAAVASRGISFSKGIVGVALIAAFAVTAIYVPGSRYLLGFLTFFGLGNFLRWLEK